MSEKCAGCFCHTHGDNSTTRMIKIPMIKIPNGYIVISAVESFRVVHSPGYRDNRHVIVGLTSGREIDTGMYEEEFLRAYNRALENEGG